MKSVRRRPCAAMRLVADENMPAAMVAILREAGHDVVFITEDTPGKADAHNGASCDRRPGSGYPGWRSIAGGAVLRPALYFSDCSTICRPMPKRFVAHSLMAQYDWNGWFWALIIAGAIRPSGPYGRYPARPLGAAPRRGSPVPAGQRCRLRSGPAPPSPAQLCNRRLRRR